MKNFFSTESMLHPGEKTGMSFSSVVQHMPEAII